MSSCPSLQAEANTADPASRQNPRAFHPRVCGICRYTIESRESWYSYVGLFFAIQIDDLRVYMGIFISTSVSFYDIGLFSD